MRRALATVATAAALAVLAGCAIQPPPVASTPPPTASTPPPAASTPPHEVHRPPPATAPQTPPAATGTVPGPQVGTTASGGAIRINEPPHPAAATAPGVVDSTPSAEALAVLNTIPEPLPRSGAAPAVAETAATRPSPTPQAAPPAAGAAPTDTAGAAPADTSAAEADDSAGVPVPSPTQPLGDRPGSLASAALPESLTVAPPAATHSPSPGTGSAPGPGSGSGPGSAPSTASGASSGAGGTSSVTNPGATPVSPDSCWRVQVAAPPEHERADRLATAARSQLLVAFVVEKEGGLYKVRTHDCLTAIAADDLKRRAVASGFEGAFRFLRKKR